MCLLGHTSSQGLPRESWQREERAAIMRLDVIQNLTIESLKGLCQCPRKSDCHLEVTPDHLKMREPMWTGRRVRSEGQNWKNSTTCPGSPLPPHPILCCPVSPARGLSVFLNSNGTGRVGAHWSACCPTGWGPPKVRSLSTLLYLNLLKSALQIIYSW